MLTRVNSGIVELTDALAEETTAPKAVIGLISRLEVDAEQPAVKTIASRKQMIDTSRDANVTQALDNETGEALKKMKGSSQEKRVVLRIATQNQAGGRDARRLSIGKCHGGQKSAAGSSGRNGELA